MEMIKVGDTAEVVRITSDSPYPHVYKKGCSGIITQDLYGGNFTAVLGIVSNDCGWYIPAGIYKKIGRLKVTKLK